MVMANPSKKTNPEFFAMRQKGKPKTLPRVEPKEESNGSEAFEVAPKSDDAPVTHDGAVASHVDDVAIGTSEVPDQESTIMSTVADATKMILESPRISETEKKFIAGIDVASFSKPTLRHLAVVFGAAYTERKRAEEEEDRMAEAVFSKILPSTERIRIPAFHQKATKRVGERSAWVSRVVYVDPTGSHPAWTGRGVKPGWLQKLISEKGTNVIDEIKQANPDHPDYAEIKRDLEEARKEEMVS